MFDRLPKDIGTWIIIIGGILLIFDLITINTSSLFVIVFAGATAYFGWTNRYKSFGKLCLGIGVIILIISAFSLSLFRTILIIIIVLFVYDYIRSQKEKTYMKPEIIIPKDEDQPIIQLDPLFKNSLFGDVKTTDRPYPWRDINIHSIYGDKVIDLSNTVLLDDVAVISIKQIVGNVEVLIPYEVEVSVHHNTFYGDARILGEQHEKIINQPLLYQTSGYRDKGPRVKIVTWLLAGNIEVKRI